MNKRHFLKTIAAGAACAPFAMHAQPAFPSRPVRLVVPFPPGGGVDSMARVLAQPLQEQWGQPVVVENRSGAGGTIGAEYVFRAEPNGHTLLFTAQQTLVTAKLFNPRLTFEPATMAPVAVVTRSIPAMFVSTKVPAETLQQFIAHAKANPGKLNYGSTGPGSTAQLAGEQLGMLAGAKLVEVPYQGVAPAFLALIGGQIDVLFDSLGNGVQYIKDGKMKVLGLAGPERVPAYPNVPTMAEVLPGFSAPLWVGVAAPPRTPLEIRTQIAQAFASAARHADFVKLLQARTGTYAVEGRPEQMASLMADEREQWVKLIKTAGLKVE